MSPKEEALWTLDASEVRAGQTWRHVKTGNRYQVVATGLDEATLMPVVIYSGHDGVVWVRALTVFLGEKDGKPRFLLAEDVDVSTAPFQRVEHNHRVASFDCGGEA
jgi:hypothetical protein